MGINPLDSVGEVVDKVGNVIDKSTESDQERQETLTERLRIDTTSPFRLPHLIRPISFIWAMSLQTILSLIVIIYAYNQDKADVTVILGVLGSNTAILTTMIGFYFQSRKNEKVMVSRANAAIKIEKIRSETDIKEREIDMEMDQKEKAQEIKNKRRDDRMKRRERRRNS